MQRLNAIYIFDLFEKMVENKEINKKNRFHKKNENVFVFYVEQIKCELCKEFIYIISY